MKTTISTNSYLEHIENLLGGGATLNAIKAIHDANAYQERIHKLMGESSIHNALNAFNAANSYQENIDKLMGASSIQNALNALNVANSYQERINKLMGGGVLQNVIKSINESNAHQRLIAELLTRSSFQNAVTAFTKQATLGNIPDWATHPIGQNDIHALPDIDLIDAEIESKLAAIGDESESDSTSFSKAFASLPAWLQLILWGIAVYLLLPVSQNIIANLATPHVEKLISNPEITEKEKIKQLKSLNIDDLDLSNHRFVTTERLYLRESPNSKSDILSELKFGQVVSVVEKYRNWMRISCEDEDGIIVQGWVFSRYMAKFSPTVIKRKIPVHYGQGGLVDGLNPLSNKAMLDAADNDT